MAFFIVPEQVVRSVVPPCYDYLSYLWVSYVRAGRAEPNGKVRHIGIPGFMVIPGKVTHFGLLCRLFGRLTLEYVAPDPEDPEDIDSGPSHWLVAFGPSSR